MCTAANDGDEALAIMRDGSRFDLLFTDIRMPGATDGWALAAEARALTPDLRVIYATGLGEPGRAVGRRTLRAQALQPEGPAKGPERARVPEGSAA